jgi:predicted acyltransferase
VPITSQQKPPPPAPAAGGRLAALDLFRGLSVVGMIFVNNPGDWGHLYWPFDHAEWHGWTPTDLIFPWFLFIVGVAGVFSLEKRMAQGADRLDLARHAFRRGMTIVLVGWLMAFFPFVPVLDRLARLRLPGVLPRIGVVFVLGTWIVLAVWRRRVVGVAAAVVLLVAAHTWILLNTGFDLTPQGNVQRAVDLAVLKGHLWKNAQGWDPEGIVSTLTAIATMLTGTLTGFFLRSEATVKAKVARLLAWGAAATAAGLLSGRALPINKNLWTGSYVVVTSGAALFGLGICLWVVDVLGWKRPFALFFTFGTNPLLVFALSGLLAKTFGLVKWTGPAGKVVTLHAWLYRGGFSWIADPTLRSHAFALVTIVFWWAFLRVFEKRGWFWKL